MAPLLSAALSLATLGLLSFCAKAAPTANNTYEYIVVGSGPGGGTIAANLAKAGHSVLLLEAGDDQTQNSNVSEWYVKSPRLSEGIGLSNHQLSSIVFYIFE